MVEARLAAFVVVAAAVLAGCGATSSSAGPVVPPSSPPTSSSPVRSTDSSAQPAACTDGSIKVTLGRQGAGLGNVFTVLLFHNLTSKPCELHGYPGVTPYIGTEHGTAAKRSTTSYFGRAPIREVVLAAGGEASALIASSDVPRGDKTSCPTYTSLQVTPPNLYDALTVPLKLGACVQLTVLPVHAGTRGTSEVA